MKNVNLPFDITAHRDGTVTLANADPAFVRNLMDLAQMGASFQAETYPDEYKEWGEPTETALENTQKAFAGIAGLPLPQDLQ